MNKIDVLKFRVTPEERAVLKERAASLGYDNFSKFLLDSALGNCVSSAAERFNILSEWYSTYHETNIELSRIGSNLNQLAKYENILSINGILKKEVIDENARLRQECMSLFEQLKSFNAYIFKELKKIK